MEKTAYTPISSETKNVYIFYFIILVILLGFMIGEKLFNDFIAPISSFYNIILSSILYVILLLFTLLYAKHTNTRNYEMGWHGSYVPKSVIIGFLATSGYLIAALGFQIPLNPNYRSAITITELLLFTLLVGITEESMFRGYIQVNFQKGLSQMRAVLMTGLLFAFLHVPSYLVSGEYLNLISLPSLVLIGLILGFIRIHTGNIWGVMLAHATWDFYMLLFTPVITSDLMTLIPALVASLAMWGSILASMLLAKRWIDRPTQMPSELAQEYAHKMENLIQRNGRIQSKILSLQLSGLPIQEKLNHYYSEIKIDNESIELIKKIIPEINELSYKALQKLMPLEMKLIKLENRLQRGVDPARKARLQAVLTSIEGEIAEFQKELSSKGSHGAMDNTKE